MYSFDSNDYKDVTNFSDSFAFHDAKYFSEIIFIINYYIYLLREYTYIKIIRIIG